MHACYNRALILQTKEHKGVDPMFEADVSDDTSNNTTREVCQKICSKDKEQFSSACSQISAAAFNRNRGQSLNGTDNTFEPAAQLICHMDGPTGQKIRLKALKSPTR